MGSVAPPRGTPDPPSAAEDLEELALARLGRVVGQGARRCFDEALKDAELKGIRSPDDLYAFARALSNRGGFEGGVGGLLAVAAVMRGATRRPLP